jgi:hypothetical protein
MNFSGFSRTYLIKNKFNTIKNIVNTYKEEKHTYKRQNKET